MVRVQLNVGGGFSGSTLGSLEECLESTISSETMAGDNQVLCDTCAEKRDTTYRTYFTQLPQVLVLHFARMTFDLETLQRVKLNHRISFPTKLDMSKYTESYSEDSATSVHGCNYELQGVQIHSGSAGGGHYYSYSSDEHGKWFKFNDDRVGHFDTNDLETEAFGGETLGGWSKQEKSYSAYMLFYRCVDA